MFDVERFVSGLHEYLERAFAPLVSRIDAIESLSMIPGERGETGEPGKSVTASELLAVLNPVIEARMATYMLDIERRAADILQRAIDKLPPPQIGPAGPAGEAGPRGPQGERGIDGLGFDTLDFGMREDGRTIVLRFGSGDQEKELEVQFPGVLYREIYKEGETYEAGDAVTWGGSLWIALRRTTSKPGEGSPDWRLAVKKGRDGRDAK